MKRIAFSVATVLPACATAVAGPATVSKRDGRTVLENGLVSVAFDVATAPLCGDRARDGSLGFDPAAKWRVHSFWGDRRQRPPAGAQVLKGQFWSD